MFKRNSLALVLLMLLTACASTPAPVSDAVLFKPVEGQAKVFMYVTYASPEDTPTFDETFQIHAPGYEGDIYANQYIQETLEPGEYIFTVSEIDWGGNGVNSFSHKTHVQAGKVYFYEIFVAGEDMRVHKIDPSSGAREIKIRKKECLC